jgi:hypothetical protein
MALRMTLADGELGNLRTSQGVAFFMVTLAFLPGRWKRASGL